ncbi:hypothetical protein CABS03_14973 [Colletotrichum abscissum]|uniref:chitinase n=1 Tax=Colletotrichum abscissum TaxID=1671311 RepID=A0A9P9XAD5_9PEZI|nr:hypothetical protein CABS02_09467 [Colletotrichum abscissum]
MINFILALWSLAITQRATAWDTSQIENYADSIKTVDYNSRSRWDVLHPSTFDSLLDTWKRQQKVFASAKASRCPSLCSDVGPYPEKWAVYADLDRLKACNETVLFGVNIFNNLPDGVARTSIRVCTADVDRSPPSSRRDGNASPESRPSNEQLVTSAIRLALGGKKAEAYLTDDVMAAGRQIINYVNNKPTVNGNQPTLALVSVRDNVMMGVYTGHRARQQGIHETLLEKVLAEVQQNGTSDSILMELCDNDSKRGADYIVGVAASTVGNFSFVQEAAITWAYGKCMTDDIAMTVLPKVYSGVTWNVLNVSPNFTSSVNKKEMTRDTPKVRHDGTCITRQAVSGDSCASLAAKCGISPADFTKYNSYDKSLCSKLVPGQHVCCRRLPDLRPKPGKDGVCHVYTTNGGDTCSTIAAAHGLEASDIEKFNKKTWNFPGCKNLWAHIKICLSKGDPPMPAEIAVPGTKRPKRGTDLADLNPCPLNACCNIWGNCGVTAEFCTESGSESGAPGTAAPGENGCISNCGVEIVKSDAPEKPIRIGYFEAWNAKRPCLNMRADQISTDEYTHIHFAFPNVTEDFKINVSNIQKEFDRFKKLTGVKRVVSLGGWAFSNDAATVHILRNAVLLQNQVTFQRNIVDFLEEHELDGIDLDWEYPEAMDIDGTPPGSELEGDLLAVFIKRLRKSMPEGKSISFAAPSSYWYLRAYPIEVMAPFVNYVVYMTYDLHGQWDHGNAFTSPGCPSGNCLRSHINMTETITALSMLTKAGMPSNKIAVGITSYGRSFHMAEKNCYSEWCLFTGTRVKSEATPGICTGEPGYIANAEIEEMREHYLTHIKSDLLADIIVYNDTEYVSYMTDEHKTARKALYDMWHMAGTSDWAVDLQSYSYDDYYNEDYVSEPLAKCDGTYDNIDDVHNDKGNIPNHCINKYVIGALGKMLKKAVGEYSEIMDDDYDKKFEYFADALRQQWRSGMSNLFSKHLDEHFDCFRKQGGGLVDHACPPFDKSPGLSTKIVLKVKDEDKLKKFILEEYTIDWDNIEFVEISLEDNGSGHGCNLGPCGMYFIAGVPRLKRNADVPNPKSSVAESISNLRKLPDVLLNTAKDINDLPADSSPEDVIDGAMLPVFMVMTATEAMNQVADIGEELEEAERKWIIGMIVTAILFVIPAIGSALTAVTGIAMIARVATLAAEAGNAVYGAIDIAENPENAVAGIFGIVLGIAGVGSAVKGVWKEAALLRRGFKAADLASLGGGVKSKVDLVDSMVKVCRIKS